MRKAKLLRQLEKQLKLAAKKVARDERKAMCAELYKIERHHRFQQHHGGGDTIEGLANVIEVPLIHHRAFHVFFEGCEHPEDFAERLSQWIDPRFKLVVTKA